MNSLVEGEDEREPATFDERDWAEVTPWDKSALSRFSQVSLDFDPLIKVYGVGQRSMDALLDKGLAIEGGPSFHGRTFKISGKGWLALEWMRGNRLRVYPQG